jgi:hypothetical protein
MQEAIFKGWQRSCLASRVSVFNANSCDYKGVAHASCFGAVGNNCKAKQARQQPNARCESESQPFVLNHKHIERSEYKSACAS